MRLIDADTLIPMMKYATTDSEIGVFPIKIGFDDIVKVINAQPTIERKTGKWEQDNPFTKPRCSECGEPCFGLHGFDYTLTPYCPNCGSDMRGEGHE